MNAGFTGTASVTLVELTRDVIPRETFFIGETTETVGVETEVYPSYTVGWASSMTSSTRTINGNTEFGFVLPSHKS